MEAVKHTRAYRPDDALMEAHMEELAVLLAVTGGEIRRKTHGGWVTRYAVMGGSADCVSEMILFERCLSEEVALYWCYQWAWSVLHLLRLVFPYISSAVTSHLEINNAMSLFNKEPTACIPHILELM